MWKIIWRTGAALLLLVLVYVLLNVRDERRPEQGLAARTFPPETPSRENGFFVVYLLAMPQGEDIFADAAQKAFGEVYSAAAAGRMSEQAVRAEWSRAAVYQRPGRQLLAVMQKTPLASWPQGFLARKEQIGEFAVNAAPLLVRYRRLLEIPEVHDFSFPGLYFPYLNVILLEDCSRHLVAESLVAAAEGKAEAAVSLLLKNVVLGRKLMRRSRRWQVNRLGLRILRSSLQALAVVLEKEKCPADACRLVAESLPGMGSGDFGLEESFAFQCADFSRLLETIERERDLRLIFRGRLRQYSYLHYSLDAYLGREGRNRWLFPVLKLFLWKNQTRRWFVEFHERALALARTPPHLWRRESMDLSVAFTGRGLWWLRNPFGKMALQAALPEPERLLADIVETYAAQAEIDLLRIAVSMRLLAQPGQEPAQLLESLEALRAVDPFSGKTYLFDREKSLLHSSGFSEILSRLGLKEAILNVLPPLRIALSQ